MTKLVMLTAFIFAVAQNGMNADVPPITGVSSNASVIITLIGFLSLLATQLFEMRRAHRQRKWDLEDRKAAREELRKRHEIIQRETLETASEIARISVANRKHLDSKISENTKLTEDVNQKVQASADDFNTQLAALRKELRDTVESVTAPKEKP